MTTADNAAQRPTAARGGLLARHPLVFFFIIAFAGTWLVSWIPLMLSEEGTGLLPFSSSALLSTVLLGIAPYVGPFLGAFIMTGVTEGREGVGRLLRRLVLWQVGLQWYLFVLLGIPAIQILGAIILPGTLASFQGLAPLDPLPLLGAFIVTIFLNGPLGEEPGWRGFALPRLQHLHGPWVGSIILGTLWGLWHVPLFLTNTWVPPTTPNIVMFVISAIALTIIMTWVFNNTKGSLLIVILLHASNDWFAIVLTSLFTAPILTSYAFLPVLVGYGAVALVLVVFTRGRLSYRQEEFESALHEDHPAASQT